MAKIIAIAAIAILCGCDMPDSWEYSVALPLSTTHQEALKIEEDLRAAGYKQIRFITHYGWSDEPTGMTVIATRKVAK